MPYETLKPGQYTVVTLPSIVFKPKSRSERARLKWTKRRWKKALERAGEVFRMPATINRR